MLKIQPAIRTVTPQKLCNRSGVKPKQSMYKISLLMAVTAKRMLSAIRTVQMILDALSS